MPKIITPNSYDCSSINKNPLISDLRDIKRREFKPPEINVLFACESLPHDKDNFFYDKHSVLFDNTLKSFQKVFPKVTQANFLEHFKKLGFYLDDLCEEPVNQLKKGKDKKKRICLRKLYETDFAKRVKIYDPKFVIITPNAIKENIVNVLSLAGLDVTYRDLPFPAGSEKNVDNYIDGLVNVLKELIEKKIIC